MSDYEVEKLGIKNELIDNVCIVSCSDDMTIKFWVNKTGEGPYNVSRGGTDDLRYISPSC